MHPDLLSLYSLRLNPQRLAQGLHLGCSPLQKGINLIHLGLNLCRPGALCNKASPIALGHLHAAAQRLNTVGKIVHLVRRTLYPDPGFNFSRSHSSRMVDFAWKVHLDHIMCFVESSALLNHRL